jgi:DNA-binding Lrp family transcriptional regulator
MTLLLAWEQEWGQCFTQPWLGTPVQLSFECINSLINRKKMSKVDDFDVKILALLQANGRLTNQELSDLVGLSASQCSRRRIQLEQQQLILGYHARVAAHAANLGLTCLVEIRLISHAPDLLDQFHTLVVGTSAIVDAFKTTGDADYMLKVAVADLAGLNHLISLFSAHRSVAHVKTSVVLDRLKENHVAITSNS